MMHSALSPPPDARRSTRSKTGLYVGLGAGALAIAGGIIAIVMLTGGGPSARDDDKPADRELAKREVDDGKPAGSCEAVGRAYDALRPEIIAMLKQFGVRAAEQAFAEDRAETLKFCREDRWPDDVIECVAKASSVMAAGACMNKLPATLVRKYKDAGEELIRKFTKSDRSGRTAPDQSSRDDPSRSRPEGTADTAALGPLCTEYKKVVERLGTCTGIPAHKLDLQRRRMESILKYVSRPPAGADAEWLRARSETSCKIQVVAITELGRASCGW